MGQYSIITFITNILVLKVCTYFDALAMFNYQASTYHAFNNVLFDYGFLILRLYFKLAEYSTFLNLNS